MIKIQLKGLVQRPPQNLSENCRQNCDICANPCPKQGRYSRQAFETGHLAIGRGMLSPLQADGKKEG